MVNWLPGPALKALRERGWTEHDLPLASEAEVDASLRHKALPTTLAIWDADSDAKAPCLLADGTLVVTQSNGQVCILKLHHGHRRITLAEAEAILVSQ